MTMSYDGFGVKPQGEKLAGSFGKMQMMFKKIEIGRLNQQAYPALSTVLVKQIGVRIAVR
jgi:hypothetical protein